MQDLVDHQNGQTNSMKLSLREIGEKIKLHSCFRSENSLPSTVRRQLSAMGLKGCVAVKKLLLRTGKKLLSLKEQWSDHPRAQASTALNVVGIIWSMRGRK